MRTRTYVTATSAAAAIAAAFLGATYPARSGAVWPPELRGHIVSVGPDGLGLATVRTDLAAGDPLSVEVCEHAMVAVAGASTVMVLAATGEVVASGTAGVCQAEPRA